MRHFALVAGVLLTVACNRGDTAVVCPQNCCFGLHKFNPPAKCERCATKEVPTVHHYCVACADAIGRCPHCGGKRPPSPKPDVKADKPSIPPETKAPPPPPPPVPQDPKKKEAPKEPIDFKLEDVKGEKLPKEDLKVGTLKKNEHNLIVFVLPEPQVELRRRGLMDKPPKEPAIAKSGDTLSLFAFWGDRLGDPNPEAVFDRKARRIVVTARWAGAGMMDAGTEYRAYGFKLGPLEAGEYRVWVREATPVDKDGPKLTKSYSFTVER